MNIEQLERQRDAALRAYHAANADHKGAPPRGKQRAAEAMCAAMRRVEQLDRAIEEMQTCNTTA